MAKTKGQQSREWLLDRNFVPLKAIARNPDNPRESINSQELGSSISDLGLQEPIKIRPVSPEDELPGDFSYVVVDGDQRLDFLTKTRAKDELLEVGKEILIRDLTREEAFDVNITINMQREDYSLREECFIVQHYQEKGLSQREIAKKCNRSKGWVSDRLKILTLPTEEQADYFTGRTNIRDLYDRQVVDVDQSLEGSTTASEMELSELAEGLDRELKENLPEEPVEGWSKEVNKALAKKRAEDLSMAEKILLETGKNILTGKQEFEPARKTVFEEGSEEEFCLKLDLDEYVQFRNKFLYNELEPKDYDERTRGNYHFLSFKDEELFLKVRAYFYREPRIPIPITVLVNNNIRQVPLTREELEDFNGQIITHEEQLLTKVQELADRQTRSIDDYEKIILWAKLLKDFLEPLKNELYKQKMSRRLRNGQEEIKRACQKCYRLVWMTLDQELCGKCYLEEKK